MHESISTLENKLHELNEKTDETYDENNDAKFDKNNLSVWSTRLPKKHHFTATLIDKRYFYFNQNQKLLYCYKNLRQRIQSVPRFYFFEFVLKEPLTQRKEQPIHGEFYKVLQTNYRNLGVQSVVYNFSCNGNFFEASRRFKSTKN